MERKNILFYDNLVGGHHLEYLENVIVASAQIRGANIILICAESLEEKLAALVTRFAAPAQVHAVNEELRLEIIAEKSLMKRGKVEAALFCDLIREYEPALAVSLYFNLIFSSLASEMRRRSITCPVRGILFDPVPQFNRMTSWRAKVRSLPKVIRKHLQCLYFSRAPHLDRIFILNDESTARALNVWHLKKQLYYSLPDPVPWHVGVFDGKSKVSDEAEIRRFLIIGTIDDRKGCIEVMRAFLALPNDVLKRVRLTISGRIKDRSYRALLEELSLEFHKRGYSNIVELNDRFLDNQAFDLEVRKADCVLTTYHNFNGSSGILGHAARHNKTVIATKFGLIGKLVQDYRLGLVVDPSQTNELTAAVMRIASVGRSDLGGSSRSKDYVSERTVERFYSVLTCDSL